MPSQSIGVVDSTEITRTGREVSAIIGAYLRKQIILELKPQHEARKFKGKEVGLFEL